MFKNREETSTYLSKILDKQNDVLKTLKSIDENIVKYFGDEYELKERELTQKILDAKLTTKQFDVFKETMNHIKEKHSKGNKECNHDWILEEQEIIKQKVCYKTYRCRICGEEQIQKHEIQDDGSVNVTLWKMV